ncbi:MAG TPA: thioredoxin family protein [Flavobacteriales bacterium]|nr:thioredoxin family protein [Flavobacteriales bacterium]
MKFFLIPVVALALLASLTAGRAKTPAPELKWYTDMSEANQVSEKTGKPLFAFFTGSDWCGWCMKLQRDVFAKDAFKEWADKNVVLLELDFPRRKQLTPELQQQNSNLQQAFQVTGYPTCWIFKAEKDPEKNHYTLSAYGSLGYPTGAEAGKEEVAFLANANQILNNKK